ncbi:MAG: cytochrome c oxidase assembly protein [Arachnia sp.]
MSDVVGVIAAVTGVVHLPAHSRHEHDVVYGWAVEPLPLVGLAVVALVYAALAVAAHRRGQPVTLARLALFATGLTVIAVALFSPIDPYGESQSPAVHMIQHELLLMVAPILLAAGLEQRLVMPVSRVMLRPVRFRSWPARLWRGVLLTVGNPWFAAGVWSLITLGWHLPVMYNLSLANRAVHNIEHVSLISAGLLFWVVLIGRLPSLHHTTTRERISALAVAMAVGGVVGAAFIWWPTILYSGYLDSRPWFGLSPWDDQRLAGFIMMVVDMPLLLGAMLVIAGRWAHREVRLNNPPTPDLLPSEHGETATTRSPHTHA